MARVVAQMTDPASVSRHGSEFDEFVFAPICEEKNGMLLTVLSALARLGIDPWQEAAQLAVLPEKTATQRLVSLIGALPDGPSAHRDPGTIAARLIALLPCRAGSNHPLRETLFGVGGMPNSRPVTYTVFIAVIFIALVLGIAASRQPAAPVRDAQATASGRVIPSPPSSGQ